MAEEIVRTATSAQEVTTDEDVDACVAAYLAQVTAKTDLSGDSSGESLNTAILGTATKTASA